MSDWSSQPYPTNPKPPAVQQPRFLYPPDVRDGYAPSSDGPDVEAVKRAVSRLGRWPWADGGGFDQDYSNRFAHGEAGGLDHSGIAGVQAQSGIDATGNLGGKTFTILRCAFIPDGLPHAGEPALDGHALELLNDRKWNKYPYAEGPGPTSRPAFPRTLYPPDHPYQPTPAGGPDVEAHKRALSRLGRWPWQTFDQTYSNGFAHGTSGNVGDTGVEGFQRQTPELDPTGNLTDKLYSHLLRALVPPCLPHAGEYAYDGYALWLLDEANKRQPATATREQALETARSQVGYAETGDNDTKYGRWYGVNYQPWCAIFATWCYETGTQTGSPSFQKGSYYAYVPYIVSDAHNRLRGLSVTSSPAPGDLVCYDWGWDGVYDHVGLFESGGPSSWQAIEGNTSSDNSGSQSNGGGVYRRSRSKSQASVVFVRVAEP